MGQMHLKPRIEWTTHSTKLKKNVVGCDNGQIYQQVTNQVFYNNNF